MSAFQRSIRRAYARPALAAVLLAGLAMPAQAAAVIHATQVVAGPTNDILEMAGTAMAPDGSGGVIYRARVEGVVHIFAIPFVDGEWRAPLPVDSEDPYGASQPAIAAGEDGRLLVVWVQPRAVNSKGVTLYELQSSSLAPGASGFGEAITVDPNVGEDYTGGASHVEPKLAMAPDGVAYVVYRVPVDECMQGGADAENPDYYECPANPGEELMDVRVARYHYLLWSSLGAINRDAQIGMPAPTPANAPTIGIGVEGNGVVAWQERENAGQPPRIWARRLFGSVQGTVLPVSPEAIGSQPITTAAETPQIAVSRFGEARLAYRIRGGKGSAVGTTQLYLDSLPSTFDPKGAAFEGSVPLSGAATAELGVPSDSVDSSGHFRLVWTQEGSVRLVGGGVRSLGRPETIGSSTGDARTTVDPAGGGAVVWPTSAAGRPVVEVQEDYSNGAYQAATLAGGLAGPVSGLSLGGSGEGDALVAWMQGPPGNSEIVGDFVQAPPSTLVLSTPSGWVRAREATVVWEPVSDAVPTVTYSVYVDGREVAHDLRATQASLRSAVLGDGIHQVQVMATDSAGQRTMSARAPLKIDVAPPIVRVRLVQRRKGVRVTLTDDASGVDAHATRISFGDGTRSTGRARAVHIYRHAGLYTITARVRDNVGVGATVHIRVRVR